MFLNFSTRTFIGYGEVRDCIYFVIVDQLTIINQVPERDTQYPALTYEEREAFAGWQWTMHQYSLQTELEEGDIEWYVSCAGPM